MTIREPRAEDTGEEEELLDPCWLAAAEGDDARVKELLDLGADVSWADHFGSTALHCACTNGYEKICRLLLSANASPTQTNENGATVRLTTPRSDIPRTPRKAQQSSRFAIASTSRQALHVACCDGHDRCAEALLEVNAAWPDLNRLACDQPDKNGATALHRASAGGHLRCVELLLGARADLRRKCLGKTALEWAQAKRETGIVALLQAAEKRAAKAREEAAQRELRARAAAADKAMAALLAEEDGKEEQGLRAAAGKAAKKKRRKKGERAPRDRGEHDSGGSQSLSPSPGATPAPGGATPAPFSLDGEPGGGGAGAAASATGAASGGVDEEAAEAAEAAEALSAEELEERRAIEERAAAKARHIEEHHAMFEAMQLHEASGSATAADGESSSSRGAASSSSSSSPSTAAAAVPERPAAVVPEIFLCPITTELMRDPVSTVDGLSYERSAIETWLATHDTSPLTGKVLESSMLIPCVLVRSQIRELLEKHPELDT